MSTIEQSFDKLTLLDNLRIVLQAAGTSWEKIAACSDQIVLFGSRAAGLENTLSDWDLLCVLKPNVEPVVLRKLGKVGFVWITQGFLRSPDWMGSELGRHISEYGIWLKGNDDWSSKAFVSHKAITRKIIRAETHFSEISRLWHLLSEPYRISRLRLVIRELQRVELLENNEAVPPHSILDRKWNSCDDPASWFHSLVTKLPSYKIYEAFITKNLVTLMRFTRDGP